MFLESTIQECNESQKGDLCPNSNLFCKYSESHTKHLCLEKMLPLGKQIVCLLYFNIK